MWAAGEMPTPGQGSWVGRKGLCRKGLQTHLAWRYVNTSLPVQQHVSVVEPGRTLAGLGRGVEKAIDHVAHLFHTVLDVLLRVLGEGHAAIPDQAPW